MKRLAKGLLRAALPLVLVGAVLMGAGWAMGAETNLRVELLNTPINVGLWGIGTRTHSGSELVGRMTNSEEHLPNFEELEIDISLGDVEILSGEDYGVELSWNTAGYEMFYECKENKLHIWSESGISINLGGDSSAHVSVYLPEEAALKKVDVKTELGTCHCSDFTAKELDVDASLGSVTLERLDLGDAELTLSLGDLTMDQITAKSMELELSMGSLTGTNIETSGKLTAENSMGDIELEGEFQGEVELDNSMGNVKFATAMEKQAYSYELDTDMGSIRIDGKKQKGNTSHSEGKNHLNIKNNMGDIEVEFNG